MGRIESFVECSESDFCQYAGVNRAPCPLTPELFAREIQAWKERRSRAVGEA